MASGHTGNVDATSKNAGKTGVSSEGRVHIENADPNLAAVAAAWPNLSPPIQAAILALVNATQPAAASHRPRPKR